MKGAVCVSYSTKFTTLVDPADVAVATAHKWFRDDKGYVVFNQYKDGIRRRLRLHREILGSKKGDRTDHINGDKLDNRRANLRICTDSENNRNRRLSKNNLSRFKGVTYCKRRSNFYARVMKDRRSFFLGTFNTAEEAHAAYCNAARELHGEFFNPG